MVEYKIFKKIADQLKENKVNPFAAIGLKGDIRANNPSDLTSLMVHYKEPDYAEEILLAIAQLMNSDTEENRKLAVIGPQGVGKTTMMLDLEKSVMEQKAVKQFDYLKKINMIQIFPFRLITDEKLRFLDFMSKGRKENNVFIFEDCQELFFETDKKVPNREIFESLMKKLESFKHSVFIFTFNAYGWKVASSKIPDLFNYFQGFVWMNGLHEDRLKEAMEKRLAIFSINPENEVTLQDLFEDEKYFNNLLTHSSKNPRLMIQLTALCIIESFSRGQSKIDNGIVNKVLEEEGMKEIEFVKNKDLIKNKVLESMLSYPNAPIKVISLLSGLDRTTVLRELGNQIKLRRVIKEDNPQHKREFIYGLKKILRAYLEQTLIEKIENKTEFISSWSSDQMKV